MTLFEHAPAPNQPSRDENLPPTDFAVQNDRIQRTISEQAHDPLPEPPQHPPYETMGRDLVNWGSPLVRKFGGGIVAAIVIGGAGIFIGHNLVDHNPSDDRVASAPAIPGDSTPERAGGLTLDSASPDQFFNDANFTDSERVAWATEQLQKPSEVTPGKTVERAAYDRLQSVLAAKGLLSFPAPVPPSIDNTPNQFNIQYVVTEAAATYEPDSDKGEKILAAIQDNQNPLLGQLRSTIYYHHHSLSEEERLNRVINYSFTPRDEVATKAAGHPVERSTPVTDTQQLGLLDPNGLPSRIVQIDTRMDNGSLEDEEFQSFVGGHWVVKRAIEARGTYWIPPTQLVNYFSSGK